MRRSAWSPGPSTRSGSGSGALWLVTELSYARTARTLEELRGLAVSHGQLHRWVGEEGARIEADLAARQDAIFGAHPERGPTVGRHDDDVWVQADGTMVHDRASGTHMEVKLGLVFQRGRADRPHPPRPRRPPLRGRHGVVDELRRALHRALRERGVYEARRILFVSDGAAAIRWIRERAFPDAIELLDWYHLVEQLRFGVGHAHPGVLDRGHRGGPAR